MLYMKKNEKHLSYLTTEQGAIIGGLIGFFATVGFFATFTPMVGIIHLIFKNYLLSHSPSCCVPGGL